MKNDSISRRNFVKHSASGIIGTVLFPHILSSCSKGANNRINIGHIGMGIRGGKELVNYFLPLADSRSLAVCDPFQNRRESVSNNINKYYKDGKVATDECKAYLDMDELLQRTDIDAVHITTPNHWHLLAAIKAARAGKHIMLARPLGLSYPQNLILAKLLKEKNLKFHFGTQLRTFEHIQLGYQMIRDGLIGEIERVDCWAMGERDLPSAPCKGEPVPADFDFDRWTGPAPLRPYCPELVTVKNQLYSSDYSIGFLGSEGLAPLDLLVWILKDKVSGLFSCSGTGNFWPAEINNNILSWDLHYKFDNGLEINFASDDIAIKEMMHHRYKKEGNGTTFYGSKGWISLSENSAQSSVPALNTRLNEFPKNPRGWFSSEKNTMGSKFISIIKGDEPELGPLEDAMISDALCHMGNITIRTGRKVTWDPKTGQVVGDPEATKLYDREMRSPYTI